MNNRDNMERPDTYCEWYDQYLSENFQADILLSRTSTPVRKDTFIREIVRVLVLRQEQQKARTQMLHEMEEADRRFDNGQIHTVKDLNEQLCDCSDRYFSRIKILLSIVDDLASRLTESTASQINTMLDDAVAAIRNKDNVMMGERSSTFTQELSMTSKLQDDKQVGFASERMSKGDAGLSSVVETIAAAETHDKGVSVQHDSKAEEKESAYGYVNLQSAAKAVTPVGIDAQNGKEDSVQRSQPTIETPKVEVGNRNVQTHIQRPHQRRFRNTYSRK